MRLRELDGIRAIAVLLVMLCHTFTAFKSPESAFVLIPHFLVRIFGAGWLGVDLFFVLSGFLITGILVDSKCDPRYFHNFYTRRVLRIFPLYFASIFVISLFYKNAGHYALLSAMFMGNCDVILHIHTPHGMSMLWSLAIEEHFYLLWPALVYLTDRKQLSRIALGICITVPAIRLIAALCAVEPMNIYQLSVFRFDGLALGAWLACTVRSESWDNAHGIRLAGILAMICAAATTLLVPFGILGTQTVAALAFRYSQSTLLFGSLVTIAYALRGTVYTSLLRSRFMVRTGQLSFCLYLVHLGIGDGLNSIIHLHAKSQFIVRTGLMFLIAYACAELSFRYFECPILARKSKFEFNHVPALNVAIETPSAAPAA